MANNESELIFEAHKGQAQFAYFLLGAAGGAIAFAIHDTDGMSLADTPWLLGVAVTFWAISFALGCFGLDARQDGLHSNAAYLRAFRNVSDQPSNSPVARAIKDAKSAVAKDLNKPKRLFSWQKWTLFGGALAYIGGHVLQMAAIPAKSAGTPPRAVAAPIQPAKE